MISILAPSRGRPEKAKNNIQKWIKNSELKSFELIVSIDEDDECLPDYFRLVHFPHDLRTSKTKVNKNRSAVDAINNAAKVAQGDILMVVSDDTDCFPGWDTAILKEVEGKTDWILKTQDGIQPWIITMPIMDRAYYNRFGYIYHPDYLHMFSDTEITCVADITGRKITSNLLFHHKHYSVTKEQPDAVNKKADATWAQGEKLFLERYKRNFDLPKGNPIQDKGMIDWLQRKAR